jgi:hypothetical protein
VLLYLPAVDPRSGALLELRLLPFRIERFRLTQPSRDDVRWLVDVLRREYRPFGVGIEQVDETALLVGWYPDGCRSGSGRLCVLRIDRRSRLCEDRSHEGAGSDRAARHRLCRGRQRGRG